MQVNFLNGVQDPNEGKNQLDIQNTQATWWAEKETNL